MSSTPKAHILYVEDDEVLSFVTRDNLEMNKYAVTHCGEGEEALRIFKKGEFDLCILDVMLPKMDGFALAEEIRKRNQSIPILFLTAKSMKEDKIHGLQLGADDYITKPFSIEELILKIEVFLRRKTLSMEVSADDYILGEYTLESKNLRLKYQDGAARDLTQKESDLLAYLIQNKNNILKREDILERVWGENDYFMGRSMDVFISRLRKYLKEDLSIKIENIHGVGFRLSDGK